MYNIGLIGKAQSGKDTAALRLVTTRRYTPLAFADPLRSMLLEVNPYVPTAPGISVRLRSLIADVGWDYAKTHYSEVRRLMQVTGQAVRERDQHFWANDMRRKLNAAESWNLPVVVTDVRYPNEVDMLRARGFRLVRIVRPGADAGGSAVTHVSETALDGYAADVTLVNDSCVASLYSKVDALCE